MRPFGMMRAGLWALASLLFVSTQLALPGRAHAEFVQQGGKLIKENDPDFGVEQGSALAVSRDGNTVAVGSWLGNPVTIWTRTNGVWSFQDKLLPPSGAPSRYGSRVALSADGNTALVGSWEANAVFAFTRTNSVWSHQQTFTPAQIPHTFGNALALSDDGKTALIGGRPDSLTYASWIFKNDSGTWSEVTKLVGTGADGSGPGASAALSADGKTALVGSSGDNANAGAVWVFVESGGTWTQQGNKLIATPPHVLRGVGTSVALSADGNTALAGAPHEDSQVGGAWVWVRSGGTWTQQGGRLLPNDLGSGPPSELGTSVALSSDGNTAVIGGPMDGPQDLVWPGATWVFTRDAQGTWSQQGSKLIGSNSSSGMSRQGYAVGMSGDGNTLITGGPYDSSRTGAFWAFVQAPTVTGITPNSGSYLGGTTVFITGSGFGGVDDIPGGVTIGGAAATNVVVINSTRLRARTAAATAGIADLTVTNAIGAATLDSAFTFVVPTPEVDAVAPNRGPVAGGTAVTITGKNFTGTSAVKFGGTSATGVTVVSDTEITATTPAHAAGLVTVAVTAVNGTTIGSMARAFGYVAPPAVTSIGPADGYVTGGDRVTITGTDFTRVTAVTFGGTAAAGFTVDSPTQISATTPAHAAGSVDVVVTAVGGTSAGGPQFRYRALPTSTTLYAFEGGRDDGSMPVGALVADKDGNLYGVTRTGGARNRGTVFMLAAPALTTRTILHSFIGGGKDGANPGIGLVIDKNGALYGATGLGGRGDVGVVFRLTPPPAARPKADAEGWTYDVLYNFKDRSDGAFASGLVLDPLGNIYGATFAGGANDKGTLFKLTRGSTVPWKKNGLHNFAGGTRSGEKPNGPLLIDKSGDVVGVTQQGGPKNFGTVYSFARPAGNAGVTPAIRYAFRGGGNDGAHPASGVVASGNTILYGATAYGGRNNGGTVFKLELVDGRWQQSLIAKNFSPNGNGILPNGMVAGAGGVLYGITSEGAGHGVGSVFKLLPPSGAQTEWTFRTLHDFGEDGADGAWPNPVMIGPGRMIYGTTRTGGGACSCGTVFKLRE